MTENPYESTDQPHGAMGGIWAKIFWRVVIYGGIIALVVALLLPNVRGSREAARRNVCRTNMKQILLALLSYEKEHGEFPPAYTVDANGNRLHSWRALILPYMEGNRVYEMIDFTKPWDAPENEKARNQPVYCLLCPSAPYEDKLLTTYQVVVGPEYLFSGSTPRKLSDVTDERSETIVVMDVGHKHAVHWMSPEDADDSLVFKTADGLETAHMGVFFAGHVDGGLEPVESDIDPKALRAMLTIAGAEEVDE